MQIGQSPLELGDNMAKYFVDQNGVFLGGFEGANPPLNSIEVFTLPADGRMTWDGSKWVEPPQSKDEIVEEQRKLAINKEGVTLDSKVNALWLLSKGDRAEFDRIDLILEKAATDFPK